VTVNSIDSTCKTDCSYEILPEKVTVSTASLSGSTLTITTTNDLQSALASSVSAAFPGNARIEFGGVLCGGVAGTLASFTCTLPTYPGGGLKV
jgi:hypothetical protein